MAPSDHQETVDKEVLEIQRDIKRIGEPNADGQYVVKFGVLFEDEKVEQFYEVSPRACAPLRLTMPRWNRRPSRRPSLHFTRAVAVFPRAILSPPTL